VLKSSGCFHAQKLQVIPDEKYEQKLGRTTAIDD